MKLICTIFFLTSLLAISQENDFSDDVAIYLDRSHSLDQYGYAYDELLKMLEKQYPKSEQNGEAWKYLGTNKEKALSDMKALLIPVYMSTFLQEEIKEMILFYEGDTGRQLVTDRSKMTEVQIAALNSFYQSDLGKKIISRLETLTQEIGVVSEGWSRDLYETAMSLLKN